MANDHPTPTQNAKSPAFQFYPRDYLSDTKVRVLSYEQRGIYWEAIALCWIDDSLPTDITELSAILNVPVTRLKKLWPKIAACFTEHHGRLRHRRLDHERVHQAESKARRTAAARARWEAENAKSNADALHEQSSSNADALQCTSSSSSTASSTSTAVVVDVPRPQLHANAPLDDSGYHRKHHALCGQVCLPKFLIGDFIRLKGGDEQRARDYVETWWMRLDDALKAEPDRPAIGNQADFLRARWEADHPPPPKPAAKVATFDIAAWAAKGAS